MWLLLVSNHLKKRITIDLCKLIRFKPYSYFYFKIMRLCEHYISIFNRKENKRLSDLVQKTRFDPKLGGKDISSYLIAPVQRLSRYKLLTDAVLKVLPEDSENYSTGLSVVKLLEKVFTHF